MKIKKILFIICFTPIISFLILETILWAFFPLPSKGYRTVAFNNSAGLKKKVLYERNAFGFRSLSMHTLDKPPNAIRIICIGASTTDQPTQATEDIWSAILEKRLQKRFSTQGVKIEVAARGRPAQTVADRLYWAQNNLLDFHPDLVILLEGINDLCFHGGPTYTYTTLEEKLINMGTDPYKVKRPVSYIYSAIRFSQIYRRLSILKYNLKLYSLILKGNALEWNSKHLPKRRKAYRMLPYVETLQREPDPINEFSDALSALVKFLRDSDIRVVILAQPVLWKKNMNPDEINSLWFYVNTSDGPVRPSTAWLEKEISRYNDIQRSIAGDFRVSCVDLDLKIPKDLRYLFDDCHFTDIGNIKVADEIFPMVEQKIHEIIGSEKVR